MNQWAKRFAPIRTIIFYYFLRFRMHWVPFIIKSIKMAEKQLNDEIRQSSINKSNLLLRKRSTLRETVKQSRINQRENSDRIYKDPIVPTNQRECTDIFCLIAFLTLLALIFLIAIYAWSAGNFQRMTTAYDPDGKGCGTDSPQYPYIYFASPHSDSLWVTTCVAKCPSATDTMLACKANSVVTSCRAVKDINNTKSVQIYDTIVTANTACLPTSDIIKNQIASAFGGSAGGMSSLIKSYGLILLSFPIAIMVAVAFTFLIRATAKLFIYLLLAFTIVVLIGIGVYLLAAPGQNSGTTTIAIISFLFAVLIILTTVFIRRKLSLAAAIVKVAANFVSQNCFIVMLPILLFIVTLFYLALWVIQALGFYSLGTPTKAEHQYPFQHFQVTAPIEILFVFHVFSLIWVLLFFIQTSNFIIGGTAIGWYYNRDKPYPEAADRYRKKHMGSVCYGALMLALLGIVRMVYNLLVPKERSQGLANLLKRCCDCFCVICNRLFEWFTVGSFAITNIRGNTYCEAGYQAVALRVKRLGTSSVVALVQGIFNLLVILGITFTTVFFIDLLIKNVRSFSQNIQDSSLILFVVAFVAFTISCFFISVYSDAIEAVYMSYLVDMERGEVQVLTDLQQFLQQAELQK